MPLLNLIFILVIVGVLMWAINKYVPMQPTIKSMLNVVVVIVLIIWLLNQFGMLDALNVPIHVQRH